MKKAMTPKISKALARFTQALQSISPMNRPHFQPDGENEAARQSEINFSSGLLPEEKVRRHFRNIWTVIGATSLPAGYFEK